MECRRDDKKIPSITDMEVVATAGEGAQIEALEADFLQDVYKVRQLRAEVNRAVHKVRLLAPCSHVPAA